MYIRTSIRDCPRRRFGESENKVRACSGDKRIKNARLLDMVLQALHDNTQIASRQKHAKFR